MLNGRHWAKYRGAWPLSLLVLGTILTVSDAVSAQPGTLPSPATLIGLGPQDLRAQLGEPALLRSDPPAQFWRYDDGPCALHVFLYRPEGGGAPVVTYAETRPTSPGQGVAAAAHATPATGESGEPLVESGQPLDHCLGGFAGTGQPLQPAE